MRAGGLGYHALIEKQAINFLLLYAIVPVLCGVVKIKPHFPAYAKITLCVLLVLIIFTEFRLKGHWVFGNINIIFFSLEFFIILLLCFVGKRAENVLIAAVLLEWLLIIQFLQDVCRYGYNFRNDRLSYHFNHHLLQLFSFLFCKKYQNH
jgi:hypothetical protein